MATTRFGHLDDFTLKNSKVGIGTSDPTEALEVIGGSRSQDIAVTGIATLTSYSGFDNTKFTNTENTNITGGESGTLSGEVVVGSGLTMSVGTGATSGQGNIKSLKVSNTFTPPIGGTNDRPTAPQSGALYYNKDFRTIEYWDGKFWRQVDNTTRRGRGLFAGGQPSPSAQIDSLELSTLGNAVEFGQGLLNANANKGAFANGIRALFIGGGSGSTDMDYVTIASASNGIDFGNLSQGRGYVGGAASSTRGFGIGGWASPAVSNRLDYVEIMTLGTAIDFGDLFTGCYSPGCASSPTRAFAYSGALSPSGDTKSTVEVFTMASKGNATDFGNADTKRRNLQNGSSSSTRAVFAGGIMDVPGSPDASVVNTISYITMASEGNALDFGDMTYRRQRCAGASTQTRAVFYGGAMGNPTTAVYNVIDYVTIATTGNALDFGDTADQTDYTKAGCSDSHGGLGGF